MICDNPIKYDLELNFDESIVLTSFKISLRNWLRTFTYDLFILNNYAINYLVALIYSKRCHCGWCAMTFVNIEIIGGNFILDKFFYSNMHVHIYNLQHKSCEMSIIIIAETKIAKNKLRLCTNLFLKFF